MLVLDAVAWARLSLDEAGLAAQVPWLPPLPPGFPLPPPGTGLLLEVTLGDAGCRVSLSADFMLEQPAAIGGLVIGRQVGLAFAVDIATDALGTLLDGSSPPLEADLQLTASLQWPALPVMGPLQLHAGNDDGWTTVGFSGSVASDGSLDLALAFTEGAPGFRLRLPGAAPDEPPLVGAVLAGARFSLAVGDQDAAATLAFDGRATLQPPDPGDAVVEGRRWRDLLAPLLRPVTLDCTLTFTLGSDAIGVQLDLHGADIELRPFDALAGLATAAGVASGEVPLDLPLRFGLAGIGVRLGASEADFRFLLQATLSIGEVDAAVEVGLRGREFVIAIGKLSIPLALPPMPITAAEFTARYPPDGGAAGEAALDATFGPLLAAAGSDDARRRLRAQRFLLQAFHAVPRAAERAGHGLTAGELANYRGWLALLVASMELASAGSGDPALRAYRLTPPVLAALPAAQARKLQTLRSRVIGGDTFRAALRSRLGAAAYATHGEAIVAAARIRGASMAARIDGQEHVLLENLTLRIDHLELVVPLAAPNSLRADGAITLAAFSEPLGMLDLELEAGVSADMIYLSLKSADGRVPMPDVGRYRGGSVSFSRFLIGFGWTRRSLALAFEGQVVLPPQLVEDLDTSSVSVLGVRLPVQTRLTFRLDLVPVPAPDVAIIVPMFQFNLDLRQPGLAALADPARCLPQWDGLQLIAGDRFRLALRHVALSPVFGFLPALNWVLGGDLVIGDDRDGLAVVVDEWMQVDAFWTPSAFKIALPGFSDDTPFVNDCCVELRFAGFGVHFHLQRPFPSLSPLALPELFALLAAPDTYPVNPRGELANSLRISVFDSGIRLPAALLALFPALRAAAGPPLTATLNLGSFITLAQKLFELVAPLLRQAVTRLRAAADDPGALKRALQPPTIRPRELLRLLPAPLQRFDAQASFAGFEGRTLLVLISPQEARQALRGRGSVAPPSPAPHGLAPTGGDGFSADELLRFTPRLPGSAAMPPPSAAELLADPLFDAFDAADLELPVFADRGGGVLAAARLRLLDRASADFIGVVSAGGAFVFVAAASTAPLQLRVAGIDIALPFVPAADGRLLLRGQAGAQGVTGGIEARGSARWVLLAGELEAAVDGARLQLDGSGRFALKGPLRLALFGGRLGLEGQIDVAPDRAVVSGHIAFGQGPLTLALAGTGLLGPLHRVRGGQSHAGARIDVTALGHGSLYGQSLAEVRVHLVGERIEVRAVWYPASWALFGTGAVLKGMLTLTGRMWFPDAAPALALEGRGHLRVQWNPKAQSPADVQIEGSARFESGPGSNRLSASGSLIWQGRRWAAGTLVAMPGGLRLGGHASFGVELPPRGLPLLARMPRLVLRLDVAGEFELDGQGRLTHLDFDAHWLLGVRFDDASDQLHPLAAGSRRFDGTALEATLVRVSGFKLLPGTLTLPVWQAVPDAGSLLDVGFTGDSDRLPAVHFQVEGLDKSLKLRSRGFSIPDTQLRIDGPAVPELVDGNAVNPDGTHAQLFPMELVTKTVDAPWPETIAPAFSLGLAQRGRDLALRLSVDGEPDRWFRLGDGLAL